MSSRGETRTDIPLNEEVKKHLLHCIEYKQWDITKVKFKITETDYGLFAHVYTHCETCDKETDWNIEICSNCYGLIPDEPCAPQGIDLEFKEQCYENPNSVRKGFCCTKCMLEWLEKHKHSNELERWFE